MLAATVALSTAMFVLSQTAQAQTYYDLGIAGMKVGDYNCDDLSVIPGVSGTVKYDPATKTLTLDNATINVSGIDEGISSDIDGLTVKLTGTNTVTTTEFPAIFNQNPMTITGGGTLNVQSTEYYGIYSSYPLTIDGCTVNAKGRCGIKGSNPLLIIKNATVTAEGMEGSIRDLMFIVLEGCEITQPEGAQWNDTKRAVTDAEGNIITTKVVIEPNAPTAIEAVTTDASAHKQGVYTLQGIRMGDSRESLPAGVYIIDGKKVVKK